MFRFLETQTPNKQKHFEISDKPQKLLARQLKGEQAKAAIYTVNSKSGEICTKLQDINNVFTDFYSELYKSNSVASVSDVSEFFTSLSLPQLNKKQQGLLDKNISIEELVKALQLFPANKSPGPDGAEFYQAFSETLTPILYLEC